MTGIVASRATNRADLANKANDQVARKITLQSEAGLSAAFNHCCVTVPEIADTMSAVFSSAMAPAFRTASYFVFLLKQLRTFGNRYPFALYFFSKLFTIRHKAIASAPDDG